MRGRTTRPLCALLAAIPLSCGGGPPAPTSGAIARGIAHLEQAAPEQPYSLAFGYFLRRRFTLDAFADAPARYDALIPVAEGRADARNGTMPNVGALRLFRRLLRPDVGFEPADLDDAEGSLDVATIRALYCTETPPPASYAAFLRDEAAAGSYRLTHAALALAWLRDNGCDVPIDTDEIDQWMHALAAIVRTQPLHELGFEAAGILAYLGHADRIPDGYLARVMDAQKPDGGWWPCPAPPCEPTTGLHDERAASHWHATALALWVLLETTTDRPADRFVPSARPLTADSREPEAARPAGR